MTPPGDARVRVLGGQAGWPTDPPDSATVAAGEAGLVLAANPAGPLALGSPDGSLGGLVLPRRFALDAELRVYRTARAARTVGGRDRLVGRVERLASAADCDDGSRFEPLWPDPDDDRDPRWHGPWADIAIAGLFLVVADQVRCRVTVFDLRTLAVRTVWSLPPDHPPLDVAAVGGTVYVLVPGAVLRYRLGEHAPPRPLARRREDDRPRVYWRRIAADRCGRLYLDRGAELDVYDPRTRTFLTDPNHPITDAGEVRDRFDPPAVRAGEFRVGTRTAQLIAVPGSLNRQFGREMPARPAGPGQSLLPVGLAARVPGPVAPAGYSFFTDDGEPFRPPEGEESPAAPVVPPYRTRGVWESRPGGIDSGIDRCVWDRAELDLGEADLPPGTGLVVRAFAADEPGLVPFGEEWSVVAAVRPTGGPADPPLRATDAASADGLIGGTPGRHLRLRIELTGDGYSTPRVRRLAVRYPRDSYLRYLPAVFQQDERGRDFLERFLAVFRAEWEPLERVAENTWRYFDPAAAPGTAAQIGYLAGWLGLPLEPGWTPEQNRALLAEARAIYAGPPDPAGRPGPSRRGTVDGLRRYLRVYLRNMTGLSDCDLGPFPVVVEGFRERRAVRVGAGAAGGPGRLGGVADAGRVVLDRSRLGADRLVSPGTEGRDPADRFAHRFRVVVPAAWVRSEADEAMLRRAIAAEAPAHTVHELALVPSENRVGVRSTVGVDTILGPAGTGAVLGDGSPLGPAATLAGPPGTLAGVLVRPPAGAGGETNLT